MTQSNDLVFELFEDTLELISKTFNTMSKKIDNFLALGGEIINILLSDENKDSASKIAMKGCILRRELSKFSGIFYHAGIYIGNGDVIHFSGMGKNVNAKIEKISLSEFSNGKHVYVWAMPVDDKHGEHICKKAENILNNNNRYNGQYDIVTNNCEDFITDCFEVDGNELPEFTQRDEALLEIAKIIMITGVRILIFRTI